ncbi:Type 1 glutamine amidotransferase-like domain-containing protein [Bacteroidales bacterium OttesenSCG-928-K03]|nr:Type 1 glutamine amidotransferase-like domain-containing protein [Bacteroidales bacterium OttesenSCG-928-K03]
MKRLFLTSLFIDVPNILQNYLQKNLTGKSLTFIPTASIPEKSKTYVRKAREAFEKMGLIVDDLEITTSTKEEISKKLQQNDFIYVAGGNTFFLLQELKKKNADQLIIEQINLGKLYIGESAGSMILSPNIEYVMDMDDCKIAKDLTDFSALNVINFYPVPHQGNYPFVDAVEKIISKYNSKLNLCVINNSQVILIEGENQKII